MANLNYVLDAIDGLTPAERLKVMDRIMMHLRAEQELTRAAKQIRLTGRAGVVVGAPQRIPPQDLSTNPYDMKGLGA